NLSHQVFGETQVMQSLFVGLDGMVRLAAIPCEALLRCAAATLSGFGVLFGVSFAGGHSALLRISVLSMMGAKKTMLPRGGIAKAGPPRTSVRARLSLHTVLSALPAFLSRAFAVDRHIASLF